MDKREHHQRLVEMLKQVAPDQEIGSLDAQPAPEIGVMRDGAVLEREVEDAAEGLRAAREGRLPDDAQARGLEAIVLPRYRPVVDIVADNYNSPPSPWTHLGSGQARANLLAVLPSIGRVELPEHPRLPYAGTGFVVGADLLMTNRHVAEIFCSGLGVRSIALRSGHRSGIDFAQEVVPRDPVYLDIQDVVMIHPHWDMAILRVSGLGPAHRPLRLSVAPPEELAERDVAVIGYPAQDVRNDLQLQNQIFRGVYNVKRLQPGKLKERARIDDSFGNRVHITTHDASTLGGNSGSAVIDVTSGEVVGLHFAGQYLVANYAVPTFELARDRRVVETGINFTGAVAPTDEWDAKWETADGGESPRRRRRPAAGRAAAPPQAPIPSTSQVAAVATPTPSRGAIGSFTLPLRISLSVGMPVIAGEPPPAGSGADSLVALQVDGREVPLLPPVIYDDLAARTGYDPEFLASGEPAIPMPGLTDKGLEAAAELDDGSVELKYHKFSIVMHKQRRLALLTAANVDWRDGKRRVNGRKPSRRELTGIPDGFAEQWVTDPRIPEAHQLPDVFFTKDRASFDKGHLVRRDDVCWGDSFEDIQMANGDTFHTTNCSPQVAGFNQATRGEFNWGDLEDLVQRETRTERAVVFAGPAFSDDDPEFTGRDVHGTVRVQIPQRYWKVIVTSGGEGPEVFGFVLEQDLEDVDWELAIPAPWLPHLVSMAEIEQLMQGLVDWGFYKALDQSESPAGRRISELLAATVGMRSGERLAVHRRMDLPVPGGDSDGARRTPGFSNRQPIDVCD